MKKQTYEWLIAAILLAPFVYLAFIWNSVPEQIPTHYNLAGEADRYGSKLGMITFMPLVTAFVYLILRYIPRLDPRKNVANAGNYLKIRLLVAFFLSVVWFTLFLNLGRSTLQTGFDSVIFVGVCLLMAGLGNYMQNIKSNYFAGIRTPWTLESETVWRKTHRWASRLWFWGGLLGAVTVVFVPGLFKLAIVLLLGLGVAIAAAVYSYIAYQQEKKTTSSMT